MNTAVHDILIHFAQTIINILELLMDTLALGIIGGLTAAIGLAVCWKSLCFLLWRKKDAKDSEYNRDTAQQVGGECHAERAESPRDGRKV